jgi:phosphate transport system substrate-binding protein
MQPRPDYWRQVQRSCTNPDTAQALREFLSWAIHPNGGNAPHYLQAVGFVALPEPIVKLSEKQNQKIK